VFHRLKARRWNNIPLADFQHKAEWLSDWGMIKAAARELLLFHFILRNNLWLYRSQNLCVNHKNTSFLVSVVNPQESLVKTGFLSVHKSADNHVFRLIKEK